MSQETNPVAKLCINCRSLINNCAIIGANAAFYTTYILMIVYYTRKAWGLKDIMLYCAIGSYILLQVLTVVNDAFKTVEAYYTLDRKYYKNNLICDVPYVLVYIGLKVVGIPLNIGFYICLALSIIRYNENNVCEGGIYVAVTVSLFISSFCMGCSCGSMFCGRAIYQHYLQKGTELFGKATDYLSKV
jgi:hypothetical protein